MVEQAVPDIEICCFETPGSCLGGGAYGQVYKAMYGNKMVAVKVFHNAFDKDTKEIINEMLKIYSLDHPNIIRIFGKCTVDGKAAYVMELMPDGSLQKLLHGSPNLSYRPEHVLSWARQCADGVSYMHAKRVMHRDLKPANLLLKDGHRVLKICDFGTASELRSVMTGNRGTPAYMAPEVYANQLEKYDFKCDVFSFGITFWEMLTRERPFDGVPWPNVSLQIVAGDRPSLLMLHVVGSPDAVVDLVVKCWDPNPAHRPTMRNVLEILSELCFVYCGDIAPIGSMNNTETIETDGVTIESDARSSTPELSSATVKEDTTEDPIRQSQFSAETAHQSMSTLKATEKVGELLIPSKQALEETYSDGYSESGSDGFGNVFGQSGCTKQFRRLLSKNRTVYVFLGILAIVTTAVVGTVVAAVVCTHHASNQTLKGTIASLIGTTQTTKQTLESGREMSTQFSERVTTKSTEGSSSITTESSVSDAALTTEASESSEPLTTKTNESGASLATKASESSESSTTEPSESPASSPTASSESTASLTEQPNKSTAVEIHPVSFHGTPQQTTASPSVESPSSTVPTSFEQIRMSGIEDCRNCGKTGNAVAESKKFIDNSVAIDVLSGSPTELHPSEISFHNGSHTAAGAKVESTPGSSSTTGSERYELAADESALQTFTAATTGSYASVAASTEQTTSSEALLGSTELLYTLERSVSSDTTYSSSSGSSLPQSPETTPSHTYSSSCFSASPATSVATQENFKSTAQSSPQPQITKQLPERTSGTSVEYSQRETTKSPESSVSSEAVYTVSSETITTQQTTTSTSVESPCSAPVTSTEPASAPGTKECQNCLKPGHASSASPTLTEESLTIATSSESCTRPHPTEISFHNGNYTAGGAETEPTSESFATPTIESFEVATEESLSQSSEATEPTYMPDTISISAVSSGSFLPCTTTHNKTLENPLASGSDMSSEKPTAQPSGNDLSTEKITAQGSFGFATVGLSNVFSQSDAAQSSAESQYTFEHSKTSAATEPSASMAEDVPNIKSGSTLSAPFTQGSWSEESTSQSPAGTVRPQESFEYFAVSPSTIPCSATSGVATEWLPTSFESPSRISSFSSETFTTCHSEYETSIEWVATEEDVLNSDELPNLFESVTSWAPAAAVTEWAVHCKKTSITARTFPSLKKRFTKADSLAEEECASVCIAHSYSREVSCASTVERSALPGVSETENNEGAAKRTCINNSFTPSVLSASIKSSLIQSGSRNTAGSASKITKSNKANPQNSCPKPGFYMGTEATCSVVFSIFTDGCV